LNEKQNAAKIPLKLTVAAVFAALVAVVTLSFVIGIPATGGYFNLGEAIIYIAALVFGPYVGAIAGGGAAIADMLVPGALQFAPGTLIIKSIEGALVGFLGKKLTAKVPMLNWRIFTILLGIIVGVSLATTGALYYSGNLELRIGIPLPENPNLVTYVPPELWYTLGAIVALLISYAGFKIEPQLGGAIFAVIIGGLEMVAGYFLYERIILGNIIAAVEIPVNIGQMLIGLIVAIPVARFVLRSFPQLKS
jgi:uncharacterized membrane protein